MRTCPVCRASMPVGTVCAACGQRINTCNGFDLYAPDAARQADGFDPALFPELAALEDRNFWFQARNRLIVHAIRTYCPRFDAFLEIGCGTGQVLRAIANAFPSARLSGSELFVEGLAFARKRVPRARFMQMDATRIPFTAEFDVIGAFDVIEHIRDDTRVLSEIHRALRPGGAVILTVPQHPWLWSHQDELAHHQRRYRRGELERKLRDCGFRVAYSTSFVSLLLPLLAASRLVARRNDDDPLREMRVGGTINALLGSVLLLELLLLRSGARLPAGGSRLVVAVREA